MDYRTLTLNIQAFVPDLSVIVIKQRVNMRYQQIVKMRDWEYLKDNLMLGTGYYRNTGTSVTTSYGATGITQAAAGSGNTWTSSQIGWWLRFGSEPQAYEVSAVNGVAGTTMSLKTGYSGNTVGLTGSSYTLFKNQYEVGANVGEILSIVYDQPIREVPLSWMNRVDPERTSTGQPKKYSVVERDKYRGVVTIQFWPATASSPYGIRVYYKRTINDLSANTDEPVCSPELLEAWALYDCYKIATVKNPNYSKLARDQMVDVRTLLAIEIESDLDSASLPDRIKDVVRGSYVDDVYGLDHDVDFALGDFHR